LTSVGAVGRGAVEVGFVDVEFVDVELELFVELPVVLPLEAGAPAVRVKVTLKVVVKGTVL
jgi:hypothetical protein